MTNVVADVQFRTQDSGHPIYVFAYAPSGVVKSRVSTKDGPPCVLAQLSPSGELHQASASGLQAYVNTVNSALQQAVIVLNNVPTTQVAGATFCVGTASTAAEATSPANSQCVATVPADQVCFPPEAIANVPGALTGLWWNSREAGWGIHFTQRNGTVFAAWYSYDAVGNPKWYTSICSLPSGAATSGTCAGPLYEVNGPTFFGTTFNPLLVNVSTAGNLQLDFQSVDSASMTYTAAGVTRTVPITRQPLASGSVPPTTNYTDLWWNPNESGWGMAITQQFTTMFLAWYVYDDRGKPMWYVATCTVTGTTCAGSLLRTTGPAFGPTFNSSQVQVFTAGTVSVSFTDGNNATLTYTVNGVSANKTITRQLF